MTWPPTRQSSTSSSSSAKIGALTASSRRTSLSPAKRFWNLLSEGIVKPDGTPGASYSKSTQSSATDNGTYQLAPPKTPYVTLPPFHAGGGADKHGTPFGCAVLEIALTPPATNCNTPANVAAVMSIRERTLADPGERGRSGLLSISAHRRHRPDQRRQHQQHARSRRARPLRRPGRERFAARRLPAHPDRSMRRSCLTTPTPRARSIACSRCGKSSTAPRRPRPRPIRRAAARISSLGSRAPSPPAPTAQRSLPAGSAKARLRWRFSTCRPATRPI